MLILTRKLGETIRINDDLSIRVLSVSGQQVRPSPFGRLQPFRAPRKAEAVHRVGVLLVQKWYAVIMPVP